jgi:phosphoribosylformylglycinamidine synthase
MSPVEIWCNEAQERYVLAVKPEDIQRFEAICQRERCPFAVVGEATEEKTIRVSDQQFDNNPVDFPMSVLFGKPPKMHRTAEKQDVVSEDFATQYININEAVVRVLQHPAVADKSFLITIGDRSVTGMVARDQMVGPWQIPVADCAVTTVTYDSYAGEAMAMGERTPLALINAPASGRMAIGEAITNISAARIADIKDIKLSANWMCAAGSEGEDEKLYRTVEAVGMDLCPKLGITVPVGKDSMSMRTAWQEQDQDKSVTAPLSLIITGFSPVVDVRKTLTPQLQDIAEDTQLILLDLGAGANRLGGSILAQVYSQMGNMAPDVDDADALKAFFNTVQSLIEEDSLLAYHDRSDGGLFSTLAEMAFAGHIGLSIDISALDGDSMAVLFNEELGAVIQVKADQVDDILQQFASANINAHAIGTINRVDSIDISANDELLFSKSRAELQEHWSRTSYQIAARRDNADCVKQEFDRISNPDQGLSAKLSYDPSEDICAPYIQKGAKPKMAILREQGVNSHLEMAAAFDRAGFSAVDVHMSDLLAERQSLQDFSGLVACGGFSYGDVLGAGEGWAKTVLFNNQLRDQFEQFFHRPETFSLGVCNGCQMLSNLKTLIPGAELWPRFVRNLSEQFEARFSLVRVEESPSILMQGMAGSYMPIAVSHGEGRAEFANSSALENLQQSNQIALRYLENNLQIAEKYPANPNGSPDGITGVTSTDGRATLLMPHPERVFRTVLNSWHPEEWGEDSGWMRLFRNARVFVD